MRAPVSTEPAAELNLTITDAAPAAASSDPPAKNQATTAAAYSVTVADLHADREQVLALWRDNPLQPRDAASKYRWFYLDNPYGASTQLFLHCGAQEAPVGVAGMVTRRFLARGVELSAGQLTDLFVQPGHRTLYPALLLQRRMRAIGLGIHDLLYAYPNDTSRQIVQRIGYTEIGSLAKFVVLLRYGEFLERWLPRWLARSVGSVVDATLPLWFRPHRLLLGSWRADWIESVDARFDSFWERAKQFDGIIGVRDARFLAWRFLARPDRRYRLFVLTQGGGAIAAYAVCEAVDQTLHIRDMLFDPKSIEQLRVLIYLLTRQALNQNFVRLSFECLANDRLRGLLRAAGMFERGMTPLVASLDTEVAVSLRGQNWYVTAADTEL